MWNLFHSLTQRINPTPRRRQPARKVGWGSESLEQRALLSAGGLDPRHSSSGGPPYIFWYTLNPQIDEGNEGTQQLELTIVASGNVKKTIQISGEFTTLGTGLGFAGDDDFEAVPFTATIPKGEDETTVMVTIKSDILVEGNEIFVARILSATNAQLSNTDQIVTIVDDDLPEGPTVSIYPNDDFFGFQTVSEVTPETPTSFDVTLSSVSQVDVLVTLQLGPGLFAYENEGLAAANDLMFSNETSTMIVTIPAGQTSVTVDVFAVDDAAVEPDEVFGVYITNIENAAPGMALFQEGYVLDNDGPPTASVNYYTSIQEGNSGTTNGQVQVFLSHPVEQDVVLDYEIVGLKKKDVNGQLALAKKKKDFVSETGKVTILAGQTSAMIAVKIVGDTVVEPDEVFAVRLTKATGAVLDEYETTGWVYIQNDDGTGASTPKKAGKVKGGKKK